MRLVQLQTAAGNRHVGVVEGDQVQILADVESTRELALRAIAEGRSLAAQAELCGRGERLSYRQLLDEQRILSPLDHPDTAHVLVTGTGLTHLGSASTRDKMHQQANDEAAITDSMKVFKWGVEGGKPPAGQAGVQPEWFYKGDGSILVRPGGSFPLPPFA